MGGTGVTVRRAEHVGGNDKQAIGFDQLAGSDDAVPQPIGQSRADVAETI